MTADQLINHPILDGWGLVVADHSHSLPRQERFFSSKEFVTNLTSERDFLRSRILEVQRFGQ